MDSKSFCILPFKSIFVRPDGKVSPCCVAQELNSNVNVNTHSIKEVFNCDELKSIRKKMVSGEYPVECKSCWDRERTSSSSYRIDWNDKLGTEYQMESDGYVVPDFEFIDVRLSNLCNFKCIMCGYEFSSNHYNDAHKKLGLPKVLNIRNNFTDELKDYISNIKYVYFAGGEPLIMNEHFQILEYLHKTNRDITIYYTTNLSTIKFDIVDLTDMWKDFKFVEIEISLDGLYERGESIRVGMDSQKVINNIYKLQESNIRYRISYTVGSYNIDGIYEFLNEAKRLKIILSEDDINFNNLVIDHSEYSLNNLSMKDSIKFVKYLKEGMYQVETDRVKNQIRDLIAFIRHDLI